MIVKERVLEQELYYKGQILLKYTIKFPCFISERYRLLLNKINDLYCSRARAYEKKRICNLFQSAIVDYEYSIVNNYPVNTYEAYVDYQVTYNKNCALSIYFDTYEYTAGAHGQTTRCSDSWNLARSKRFVLGDVVCQHGKLKDFMVSHIVHKIDTMPAEEREVYFENYAELVNENLKCSNFYLSDEGVVLFFQQYDIAPYSTGIPTFTLPYDGMIVMEPSCRR